MCVRVYVQIYMNVCLCCVNMYVCVFFATQDVQFWFKKQKKSTHIKELSSLHKSTSDKTQSEVK